MKKDQYFNQHRNLDIHKAEMERKWRAYIREQEEMELARMHAIYEAQQQQQSVVTSPGAGGGGDGFNLNDYGIQTWLVGVDNDALDGFAVIFLNYETDEIKKIDLGIKYAEFNPPQNHTGGSFDVINFQNAGYALPCEGYEEGEYDGITRWIFLDANGSILDKIDINENNNPVLYYVEINSYTTQTGMLRIYNRYENGSLAGVSFLWFNGVDKPMKYDMDSVYLGGNLLALFNYSDRKGNFLFKFDRSDDTHLKDVYLIGKKMTLVKSFLNYTEQSQWIGSRGYTYSNGEVTALVLQNDSTNDHLSITSISSDHTIIEDTDVSSYGYDQLTALPYGSSTKFVFILRNGITPNAMTLLQVNGTTKKIAKKDFIKKSGGYDIGKVNATWDTNYDYLPETFGVFTYTGSAPNGYGIAWNDYELHYISGDEDEWNTFERANIWIGGTEEWLKISGKGLYFITDNDGPSLYLAYLSGGNETYNEIAQKSWQNGEINTKAIGVSSAITFYRGQDNNQPYVKIFKDGNSIEMPFDGLINTDQGSFGVWLIRSNSTYEWYWYGEEAGKIEKVVFEEGSSSNSGDNGGSGNCNNNVYPGCRLPLFMLNEDKPGGIKKYHLFSPSSTSVTEQNYLPEYGTGGYQMSERFLLQWSNFTKLYTAEEGAVAEYASNLSYFDSRIIVGKRVYYSLWVHQWTPQEPYQTLKHVLLGKSGAKEFVDNGGVWWQLPNDTKNF